MLPPDLSNPAGGGALDPSAGVPLSMGPTGTGDAGGGGVDDATREVSTTHHRMRFRSATEGPDVGGLVASAARLRWRAPELALLMADHASTTAAEAGVEPVRLRAEVLAVFACNQLGRGAEAGGRAVRALRAAQRAGEETTEQLIRVELAACAADASAPHAGLTVLQPVLERMSSTASTARAAAMVTAADCLARLGGGPDVAALLDSADKLYDGSRSVEPDACLLRRGVVHARLAAYHRRRGDHRAAEAAARAGIALVDELSDGELDTGQVSGALLAELVLALLDAGQVAEAVLAAQPVLRRPTRPAGAAAACWLRLALVSRVHLPAGRHGLARRLLGEAAADAERNHLDSVLAECRQVQAQLHETCAELGEALHSLRAAYVADRRWRDTVAELRALLAAEFGPAAPAAELRSELSRVLADHRIAESSPKRARVEADEVARAARPIRPRPVVPAPLPAVHTAEQVPAFADEPRPAPAAPDATPTTDPIPVQVAVAELSPPLDAAVARRPHGESNATGPVPVGSSSDAAQFSPEVEYSPEVDYSPGVDYSPVAEPAPAVGAEQPAEPDAVGAGAPPSAEVEVAPAEASPDQPTHAEATTGGSSPNLPAVEHAEAASWRTAPEPMAAPSHGPLPERPRLDLPAVVSSPDGSGEPASAARSEPDAAAAEQVREPLWPRDMRPAPENEQAGVSGDSDTSGLNGSLTGVERPSQLPRLLGANGTDRTSGRHRSDVAMADLLAEALMAYENGRRSWSGAAGEVPFGLERPRPLDSRRPPEPAPSQRVPSRPEPPQPPVRPEQPPQPEPPQPEPPQSQPASQLGSPEPPRVRPAADAPPRGRRAAEPQQRVRWMDLPPELVWREPKPGHPA